MSGQRERTLTVGAFVARLAGYDAMPVLALRLPQIERIAWLQGRERALDLERRALDAFTESARRVLRAGDLLAHDTASDTFAAALCADARSGAGSHSEGGSGAPDARAAVARIGAALTLSLTLDVQTGWTIYDASRDAVDPAGLFARAFEQGARERERYAFFSLLGHELRTPLASIRGYLETLLDDGLEPSTRDRFTRIAYRESLRMSRLIEGLFEISLLDLHGPQEHKAHAALDAVLNEVRDAVSSSARTAGTTIVFAPCGPLPVAIDAGRLVLILVNVIENAIKHGRARGSVRVETVADGATIAVIVDDDGHGVPSADRERIFTLGGRAQSTARGSGIGLALVRLLVERVGGRVTVDRAPMGGARFIVTLPRVSPARIPMPACDREESA